jgi:hypothetical protein
MSETAYPKLCASRLHVMVRERGYRGGADHFRSVVARFRPRPIAETYLRLRTLADHLDRRDLHPDSRYPSPSASAP